jgi:hypothetical protein
MMFLDHLLQRFHRKPPAGPMRRSAPDEPRLPAGQDGPHRPEALAWHVVGGDVYHHHDRCPASYGVPHADRLLGTGGKPECPDCRRLRTGSR